MPVVMSRVAGLVSIRQPALTQTLGPWYRAGTGKYCMQLAREKDLAEELIAKLPRHDFFSVNFHHTVSNWLPFYWRGFEGTPRMTYLLRDLRDEAALWAGIQDKTRSEIRKAQKQLEVISLDDVEQFINLNEKTFARQGLKPSTPREIIERVDAACARRGARKMLFAVDGSKRMHAAVYLVWDERSTYYLMSGADPALRNSGAGSLLMWEAIRHAMGTSRCFDFEGSMKESIERFFRSFGGIQAPYLNVRKAGRVAGTIQALRAAGRALRRS